MLFIQIFKKIFKRIGYNLEPIPDSKLIKNSSNEFNKQNIQNNTVKKNNVEINNSKKNIIEKKAFNQKNINQKILLDENFSNKIINRNYINVDEITIEKRKEIKKRLLIKIEENIIFLEELSDLLFNQGYFSHHQKVMDLIKQSNSSFNITKNLSVIKIYFENTIHAIKNHTQIITSLVKKYKN